MIADLQYVGIDVSKLRLDVHIHPHSEVISLDNYPDGHGKLITKLKRFKIAAVGLEASGGYERQAADTLAEAGFTVYVLDPAQVRAFARSMKARAKTDALDAAMIARYLAAAQDILTAHKPDPLRRRLAELNAYRRKLIAERNGLVALLDTTHEPLVKRLMSKRLGAIKREIATLEDEIRKQIASQPHLAERFAKLQSLPGVGPVLATTLITELPELGHIGAKRIASLAGVAPHARQSGQTDRGGRCSGGRKTIRDVLYMATLSALKARMPHLYPSYNRLRSSGKPFKKALVACMRKFLTIINAIIRDNAQFNYKTI
jgi:transposase